MLPPHPPEMPIHAGEHCLFSLKLPVQTLLSPGSDCFLPLTQCVAGFAPRVQSYQPRQPVLQLSSCPMSVRHGFQPPALLGCGETFGAGVQWKEVRQLGTLNGRIL